MFSPGLTGSTAFTSVKSLEVHELGLGNCANAFVETITKKTKTHSLKDGDKFLVTECSFPTEKSPPQHLCNKDSIKGGLNDE